VREALASMFDFEWINANLFDGAYQRSEGFFDDSELSSIGTPASPRERALHGRGARRRNGGTVVCADLRRQWP
jgi:ABC-type oligopeptide transport system substrate-binding subunit